MHILAKGMFFLYCIQTVHLFGMETTQEKYDPIKSDKKEIIRELVYEKAFYNSISRLFEFNKMIRFYSVAPEKNNFRIILKTFFLSKDDINKLENELNKINILYRYFQADYFYFGWSEPETLIINNKWSIIKNPHIASNFEIAEKEIKNIATYFNIKVKTID